MIVLLSNSVPVSFNLNVGRYLFVSKELDNVLSKARIEYAA
jgi:hypothetical protein